MKHYLKRVFTTFIFLNALIILTGIFAFFVSRILFFAELSLETLSLIGAIPATILMIYFACLVRWENKVVKQQYFETQAVQEYSFRNDYLATFRSRENIVHTLAFASIIFVNSIRIAASVRTPLMMFLLKVVFLLIIRGVVFSALNTLIWCLAHRKWRIGRFGAK